VKYKTLLCFDYGSKRIGTAVGQALTGTATPLEIVLCHRNRPDWQRINQLIKEWRPDALIVGIPINMNGGSQAITAAAARFARQLEGRFKLPVFGMDERLSTFEARLRTKGDKRLDSIAAQTILETWLSENK